MDDDLHDPSSSEHIFDPAAGGPAAPAPHFPLGAAHGGGAPKSGGGAAKSGDEPAARSPARPTRIAAEPHRALRALNEGLARRLADALRAMLRGPVEVQLAGIESLAYQQFVARLEDPTCYSVLTAEPLPGCLVLDISPRILYPMIDRLLGGGREEALMALRPLTGIEMRIVARIVKLFAEELRVAWRPVLEVRPELVRVETRAGSAAVLAPERPITVIRLEVALGEIRGLMSLGIPQTSLERLGGKSLAADATPPAGSDPSVASGSPSPESLVSLRVDLAGARIAKADLAGLQPGDIITTEKPIDSPLDVTVDGIVRFRALPGAIRGRKAIRIEEPVTDSRGADC